MIVGLLSRVTTYFRERSGNLRKKKLGKGHGISTDFLNVKALLFSVSI